MKLHPHFVSLMAEQVIADLIRDRKISTTDNHMLVGLVENVIQNEMDREARIDEEVREVLAEHYEEMRHSGASYDEMFRRVKEKLAKDRGVVL